MIIQQEIQRSLYPPARIIQGGSDSANILGVAGRQQSIWNVQPMTLPPGETLVVDFGEELHGGIRIVQSRVGGNGLPERPLRGRLRFGESVSEAIGTPDNQHAVHDTQLDVASMGESCYGNTGFRFASLQNLDTVPMKLIEFSAWTQEAPHPPMRKVDFKDPLLNQIFQACARTIRNCIAPLLLDGAKRDRLVWMGDIYAEIRGTWAVYGDHPAIPATLDFMLQDAGDGEFNGMPTYLPYWFLSHCEYLRLCGNQEYFQAQAPHFQRLVQKLMDQWRLRQSEVLDWTMIDWSSYFHSTPSAYLPLYCNGLKAAMHMAKSYGMEAVQQELEQIFQQAAANLALPGLSKAAAALAALAGIFPAHTVCQQVLQEDPHHQLSTFHLDRMLEVWSLAGRQEEAVQLLKHYYGAMLKMGATTFWEHFELDWVENSSPIHQLPDANHRDIHLSCGAGCFTGHRHSLCHGWSAAVAAWMLEHLDNE